MNNLFKNLPLPAKLLLIAIIPLLFLLFVGFHLYKEKVQKLDMLESYRQQVTTSQQLIQLTVDLQKELRYSYLYNLKKDLRKEMVSQRQKTDMTMQPLENHTDSSLSGFTDYTFLNNLQTIRAEIDSNTISTDVITSFYINAMYRINTIAGINTSNQSYMRSVSQDLSDQKVISQMMCFLGIIRTNIFNALYTGDNNIGILYGLRGTYDIFRSYEKELLATASPEIIKKYVSLKQASSLLAVDNYIERLFRDYAFDQTFTAESWWKKSGEAMGSLSNLQKTLQQENSAELGVFYNTEQMNRKRTIVVLFLGFILVGIIVFYSIRYINIRLREINRAAQKISKGITGINLGVSTNDVIGQLARSINIMDKNNTIIAETAQAIGKGNFNISVQPRSQADVLGNAIKQMRDELKEFTLQQRNRQQSLTKAILNAQEKERERIGAELHDNINQLLTSVHLYLGFMHSEVEKREELIPKSKKVLALAIEEIRKLSRNLVIPGLRGESLQICIKELINDLALASGIQFHISCEINEDLLTHEMKTAIYRIIQEQLTNVIRYADARRVDIKISVDNEYIILTITDNGKGFDTEKVKKGTGLSSIISRCELLNGELQIVSSPGKGCCLYVAFKTSLLKAVENEENRMAQLAL